MLRCFVSASLSDVIWSKSLKRKVGILYKAKTHTHTPNCTISLKFSEFDTYSRPSFSSTTILCRYSGSFGYFKLKLLKAHLEHLLNERPILIMQLNLEGVKIEKKLFS